MKCNAYNEKRCHSCDFLDFSYEESLSFKERHFFSLFDRKMIGNYLNVVKLDNPNASRNKVKLSVAHDNGEISFGIYTKEFIFRPLMDCPLHLDGLNGLLIPLKSLLEKYNIIPYDLTSKKGELKLIIMTKSDTTDEMMIRFVLRSKESIDRLKKLVIELKVIDPLLKVCSANLQPLHAAILEGKEEILLTDEEAIHHFYDKYKLHLGPKSFFQVTGPIARKLYQSVGDFFAQNKVNSLLDLYCGVGAFSFYVSSYVPKIKGVELSADAISFANKTKAEHQLPQIDFEALDVESFLHSCLPNFEAVITNPPRRGVGEKGMKILKKMAPKYLVYSSCHPATLKSDLEFLEGDYRIVSSQIFDMFPFSKHYEVLMILEHL